MYNVDIEKILANKSKNTTTYVSIIQEHTKEELLDEVCVKYNRTAIIESSDIVSLTDREFMFEYQMIDLFGDDEDITLEAFQAFIENAISLFNYDLDVITEGKAADVSRKVTNKVTTGVRRVGQKIDGKGRSAAKNLGRIDKSLSGIVNKMIDKIYNLNRDDNREKIITGRISVKLGKLLKNTIVTLTGAKAATMLLGPVGGTLATIITALGAYACHKNTKNREKKRILLDLETELKIVTEKIEDAKGENDKKQKYELMRTQAALEKEITRIKYNMKPY